MRPIIVAALAAFATPAAAQFVADVPADEIRRTEQRPAVMDMAVGEVGLTLPRLCLDDNAVYISGRTPLLEKAMDFTVMVRVRREPGGKASLTSEVGKDSTVTARENWVRTFVDMVECENSMYDADDLLPVSTIDGLSALRQLLAP